MQYEVYWCAIHADADTEADVNADANAVSTLRIKFVLLFFRMYLIATLNAFDLHYLSVNFILCCSFRLATVLYGDACV